jgi:peptide/nickel transport system permease protein
MLSFFIILVLNFGLMQAAPGDPVQRFARSSRLTLADQERLREEFGLDKSMPVQFFVYLKNAAKGDFGLSFITGQPVRQVILAHTWPTLLLVGLATILATIIGVFAGIVSAWRRGSATDKAISAVGMAFYAMPDFWLGMMLLIIFAGWLAWFPVGGYSDPQAATTGFPHLLDVARHLTLPCAALTVGYLAEYQLIMRSALLDVMGEDFITITRAKGLRDSKVRMRHAVPNAMLPTITMTMLYFGYVVGGAIGVEFVFSYPGLGTLTANAIEAQDYPMQQGLLLMFAAIVLAATLFTDVLYGYLDPRIREA